mgnify:FL=1
MRSTKSRTGWRAISAPCAVVTLAVSLAGCGGVTVTRDEPSLDTDKIQSELQSKLADSIPGSTASVTCPSDVELQQGATFDCTAILNGQQFNVEVTQTNDQGDVTYVSDSAFVSLEKVQDDISTELAAKVPGTWATECSPQGASGGVYVATLDSTFTCQVTGTSADGEQQAGQVEATVVDLGGGVSWRLVE